MSSQLEDVYREAVAQGMTEADADAHARAQIADWRDLARNLEAADRAHRRSGVEQWSERLDDGARAQGFRWRFLAILWQNLRYATCQLVRQPGYTAVMIVTLALGIGANTAIFSLIDALLLDSLPIDRPRELVLVTTDGGFRNGWTVDNISWSHPAYRGLRDGQHVFSGLIAERIDAVNLTIDGTSQRAIAGIVSGNYFDVLGVRPLKGRLLSDADDRVRGEHPVVVLSYGFWVERFGMLPDIVGEAVQVGGHPFIVIGIADRRFSGLEVGEPIDLFVTTEMLPDVVTYRGALDARNAYIFHVYGRLEDGVSRLKAEAQLQPLFLREIEQDIAAMSASRPKSDDGRQGRVVLEDGHRGTSALRRDLRTPLTAVMAMTILLLAIACANIAGLQIARASARMKEISIRLAMGASRGQVVAQLLIESALIVAIGAAAALAVADITTRALVREMGEVASRFELVMTLFDARTLAFILAVAATTTLLISVVRMLDNALIGFGLDVEGYVSADGRRAQAAGNAVAPGYFQLMNTPLVRGRDFTETDTAISLRVAIVSESFVGRYLPNVDPIGRTISLAYGSPTRFRHEIVGVSKNARLNNLRQDPPPTFYLPYTQFEVLSNSWFLVRTGSDPSLLRRSIEEAVRRFDPQLPVVGFVTLDGQIDRLLRPERLVASLSLAFGLLATGLAAIGLYGVMAFSVARRTREIGLRMALGADRASVIGMVLRGAAGLSAIGIGLGAVLALALGRYVESQLYGIQGRDPGTFAAAAGLLIIVVITAAWWPARRASQVDPISALRQE